MKSGPVKLIECPRDAWQGLDGMIPADLKANYLKTLISAGFKHIDAVSFVSPKAVPQMADSEKVLAELDPPDDVEIIAIVVNEKGVDRAIATEAVRTVGFPYSISETFLRRNQNQTPDENYEAMEQIYKKADEAGLDMVVYISMAFGNPYGDLWNLDEVMAGLENITDLGVRSISLADTVGLATPEQVATLAREAVESYEDYDIGVHLHSRRDQAAAKILAAYKAGIRRFDSAIGGLGGCPFASDALIGNIPTEVVLKTLEERVIGVPIRKSLDEILAMNAEISGIR